MKSDMNSQTSTGTQTMTAIVQDGSGTIPENVLHIDQVARPTIGDDEVLVGVHACQRGSGNLHIMTGLPKLMRLIGFGLRRPKQPNPGRSVAGTVEAVGKNVVGFQPGDEVYGMAEGSLAEYARAQAGRLSHNFPRNLTFEQAAAVPVSAVTALQAVRDHAPVAPARRCCHRRLRGCGDIHGADRKGLRCRGDRCVQHGEDGIRPRPWCRPRR